MSSRLYFGCIVSVFWSAFFEGVYFLGSKNMGTLGLFGILSILSGVLGLKLIICVRAIFSLGSTFHKGAL